MRRVVVFLIGSALLLVGGPAVAAEQTPLWEIGRPDGSYSEFALAPDHFGDFRNDGFYVVGQSDSRRDWPYVQPGPADVWAGARPHVFTVLFGLQAPIADGECQLRLRFINSQRETPPKLRVQINGTASEHQLPAGQTDDVLFGKPETGKNYELTIPFPARVLKAGNNVLRITTVSGSWTLYDSVSLVAPPSARLAEAQPQTLIEFVEPIRALVAQGGRTVQPIRVTLRQFGEERQVRVSAEEGSAATVRVRPGLQTVELVSAAVTAQTPREVRVEAGGTVNEARAVPLKPVPKMTIYVLPHSHTDIGYTESQAAVADRQTQNLVEGIRLARKTAAYPPGARFVWNVEVAWAVDQYLRRLGEPGRRQLFDAVREGQVVVNALYLNELTGLCRPEELLRLLSFASEFSQETGVPIETAMISDVPGYSWGTVTALSHAGVKYLSAAPNYFARIGTILSAWENKPFYWLGPDGRSKVLVWIPFWGYALSSRYHQMSPRLVDDLLDGLAARSYPYDVAYVRWSGDGDNRPPDPSVSEFVKDWNQKYAWPRFVISGPAAAFKALEARYGQELPVASGDLTPYWEDGAGSSAFETGLNRWSSDRLAQAETVFALRDPSGYPADAFESAWRDVLLYSEHTWGAWCSVTEPERRETQEQWAVKKSYAEEASLRSKELLNLALAGEGAAVSGAIDVYNTMSWPRTGLVTLSREMSAAGDRVTDESGAAVPAQRLASGELVFLARDVPPLASKRFRVSPGAPPPAADAARVSANVVENGIVRARVDEKTGEIVELTRQGSDGNFVDASSGFGLDQFTYMVGDDNKHLRTNGPVKITPGEPGPLVASLIVDAPAPGVSNFRRELRVVAGQDAVEINNLLDKTRLKAASYVEKDGKESINFGFAFAVPGGEMVLDVPLAALRPERDQLPGSNKNWLPVGRWLDVSNAERGVTWATLDAPLVEIGEVSADVLNSIPGPEVWRAQIAPTQKFYSWAINNHWDTNYRAYQEGPVAFRYAVRPHRQADTAEAARFSISFTQPLLATPADDGSPRTEPLLQLSSPAVLVSALKPSRDGKALIVRLFEASGAAQTTKLRWGAPEPTRVWLSDTSERPLAKAPDSITVPGWGVVTLRAELK